MAGAHYGGFGMGADIDYLLMHGRGVSCIIPTNKAIHRHFLFIGRASRASAESKWRGTYILFLVCC